MNSSSILMLRVLIFLIALNISCGEEATTETDSSDATLIISEGSIFTTPELTSPSGGTILIVNNDQAPHTITSQSAEDTFDNTGDFEVAVASEGNAILTLPEAESGTIFYYYCALHFDDMSPSTGTITIE